MVHRLRREVRPGPVLRHHVGEAPGELYEEVEPGHVVHVIVLGLHLPHNDGDLVSGGQEIWN